MFQKNTRSARGGSSVLAVFFVTLFAVLAISFTGMTNVNMHMAKNHKDLSDAQAMAESGLQYAALLFDDFIEANIAPPICGNITDQIALQGFSDFADYLQLVLNNSPAIDYSQVSPKKTFIQGTLTGFEVTIPPAKFSPDQNASFRVDFRQYSNSPQNIAIVSYGQMGKINRIVRLDYTITKTPVTLFDFGLFARGSIDIQTNGKFDIVNVDPGDYRPLQIGTNSTDSGAINLGTSGTINGDILVGYGGDPDYVIDYITTPTITGDVYPMSEPWDPPVIEVPAALLGAPSQGTITSSTTITTSGKYDSIDMAASGVITIDGDVTLYITGDITASSSFELRIVSEAVNPNASLTLYLGGNFIVDSSCKLNNLTQDPVKLQIYALPTCNTINLANSGKIYAAIYAPDTDVTFQNSVDIYGSLVTKSSTFQNSVDIIYDARLRDLEAQNTTSCPPVEIRP